MNYSDLLNLVILGVSAVTALATLPQVFIGIARYFGHKTTGENLRLMRDVVSDCVQGVEQEMKKKTGKAKKEEALARAKIELDGYGVDYNESQLRSLIEAAVWRMNRSMKLPEPPTTTEEVIP